MTPALVVFAVTALARDAQSEGYAPASVEAPSSSAAHAAPNIVIPVVHSFALMGVMRATESYLWPQPFSEPKYFGQHYEDAFTKPPKFDSHESFMQWDGDRWYINTIGHGLFGSELYLRARQCRFGWAGSLAFAAATSAVWEYGFEGNGTRPSALDLVYTPLMGAVLGEARFLVHRAAKQISSPITRSVVRTVVDPLGELERAVSISCE